MLVMITPGSMLTTRTPNRYTSCASASPRHSSAHFDAEYATWFGVAMSPAIDVMLTIAPLRRSRMLGSTAWMQRTAPK